LLTQLLLLFVKYVSGLGSGDILDLVLSLECPCLVVVRDTLYARLFVEMSVLVCFHLRETKNSVLTLPAVVMSLFPIVTASWGRTVLRWGKLLKACSHDAVQLLMLPSMCHHLVRVRAVVVALEAVEMTAALLVCAWQVPTCVMQDVEFAVVALAGDPAEPLELVPAQRVKPLVTRSVLDESGLVAEAVVAVLAHAVEVGLVLPVVAVGELAVLIEPESHVALRNGFVFEHPHT